MPLLNEHSARIQEPKNFDQRSIRSINIDDGIRAIVASKPGESKTEIISYRFKKEIFSELQAKKWLKSNNISYIRFEPALKAVELKNVDVHLISILHTNKKPSNRQAVIYKNEKNEDIKANYVKNKPILKFDEEKGLLYSIAMKANYIDTDGEAYSNETIEKTAHNKLKAGIYNISDQNHNFEPIKDVYLVESYVDKSDIDSWEWKTVLDINNSEELKKLARENKITGVSIAGIAGEVVKMERPLSEILDEIEKLHNEAINHKDYEEKEIDIKTKAEGSKMELTKEDIIQIFKDQRELEKNEKAEIEKEETRKNEIEELQKQVKELTEKENERSEKIEKLVKENEDLKKEVAKSKQKDSNPELGKEYKDPYDFINLQ